MTLLLTGATGFVGMEVLARELRDPRRRVVALIRAHDNAHATMRLHETLRCVFGSVEPYADRVRAIAGDLEEPGLGIDHRWTRGVTDIIHCAACVSFDLPLERARAINVDGTRRVLEVAAQCRGLRRFTHVSTAHVAGEHRGSFGEADLDVGQRFRNTYEMSKYDAERLVRLWARKVPVTIVRPSIVVGDRHSGWTPAFNVLYRPLRALADGAFAVLPARRDAAVDVVSVDYVADAICALHEMPEGQGGVFHVTAAGAAGSIDELLDLAVERLGCARPRLVAPPLYRRCVHPALVRCGSRDRRRFLRATETCLPYLAMRVSYDDAHARATLGESIAPAPLSEYFDRLIDYALLARWGERGLSRAAALDTPPPARRGAAAASAVTRA